MTTTQPPLKPGDRVLVEAEVIETLLTPSLRLQPVSSGPGTSGYVLTPDRYRWHPMPAEDGPDATHVARLEAELAALRKVYDAAEAWRDRLAQRLAMAPKRVVLTDRAPALVAAVDAFRAAQTAPATAPGATLADETPATLPEPGDAPSEAQRGAEAVCSYARLCREVAIVADKTMRLAQFTHAAGASPTHVQDLTDVARTMLALIPDEPPAAPRSHEPAEAGTTAAAESKGEYEALRAGVAALAENWDEVATQLLAARDRSEDRHRRGRLEHVASAYCHVAAELRALLAPATSTPDGTTTAGTGGAA